MNSFTFATSVREHVAGVGTISAASRDLLIL